MRVAEAGEGRFAQLVTMGRHRLRDDEPAAVEVEQQKYISALPLLPPLSEKTLRTYYTVRLCGCVRGWLAGWRCSQR